MIPIGKPTYRNDFVTANIPPNVIKTKAGYRINGRFQYSHTARTIARLYNAPTSAGWLKIPEYRKPKAAFSAVVSPPPADAQKWRRIKFKSTWDWNMLMRAFPADNQTVSFATSLRAARAFSARINLQMISIIASGRMKLSNPDKKLPGPHVKYSFTGTMLEIEDTRSMPSQEIKNGILPSTIRNEPNIA